MRRQTCGSTGRRGSAIAASAVALCLGTGLLSGCGSGPGDGYVAVGAAAEGSDGPSGGDGRPSGEVTLTPLDESGGGAARGGGGGTSPSAAPASGANASPGSKGGPGPGGGSGNGSGSANESGGERTGAAGGQGGAGGAGSPGAPGSPGSPGSSGSSGGAGAKPSTPSKPSTPTEPSTPPKPGGGSSGSPEPPAPPPTPAALTLSAPERAAADKRWCEKVTVEFRNTGGSPVRSGTVTFATHIIGALGVDWATITSSQPLPAPIAAGSTRSTTYTVCVESWRVPLGMRVETQDVSAAWE
ncbi:hypothetical protein [Streptomyces griseus]|uniref:hypothetical protein n=1 Tax=Streptomyces griseus TaxID=1911 RepID=UPI003400C379